MARSWGYETEFSSLLKGYILVLLHPVVIIDLTQKWENKIKGGKKTHKNTLP